MKECFLGDSYDVVKRFWAQSLHSLAPLYAHPRFIPAAIRAQYSLITTIPVFDLPGAMPDVPFGVLLDPNTGIPLPNESSSITATADHAPLDFIARLMDEYAPSYLICFDQSHHRVQNFDKKSQRRKKTDYLFQEHGLSAFYYVSHAPFLFTSQAPQSLTAVLDRLTSIGVPRSRFELELLQSNPA